MPPPRERCLVNGMTLRFATWVALFVTLSAAPARAEFSPSSKFSLGGGLAHFLYTDNTVQKLGAGIALESELTHHFHEDFSLTLRFDWALTDFDRTLAAVRFGNEVTVGTARAYEKVTRWWTEGDEKYRLFKFMAALFAYMIMPAGFGLAMLAYVVSPFLATTFLEGALTASTHLGSVGSGAYVEMGLGTLFFVHPSQTGLFTGAGPVAGVGFRGKRVGAGVHLLYSPPQLNSSSRGHVYAGAIVLRFSSG